MRYLSLIFFIFLSLHSYFVFAEDSPQPTCSNVGVAQWVTADMLSTVTNQCNSIPSGYIFVLGNSSGPPPIVQTRCDYNCVCPTGSTMNTVIDGSGNSNRECIPDEPSENPDDPDSCDESEKVYDPVSGSMVCPGSGDGSSSASSQSCVVPGDYNGDCIPDEEQGSSAANSSAAASSGTGSSSGDNSSTGGGDGGDGGNNGGGGSGDNGGGGTTGGGSSSGWTPNSGYGNWIPVNPNSPCPNKYQDIDGQWWCWGGSQESTSSAGSAGSASSGSNSSGSASSAYSGGDGCESEPVCPAGEPACLQLLEMWNLRCGGVDEFDDKIFEIENGGEGEGTEPVTFTSALTNFKSELEDLPNVQAIDQFFSFNASGSCPTWQVSVWVFDITIDQLCSDLIPWEIIAGILIAVACLIAARVALT